jgi:hypothetical protein
MNFVVVGEAVSRLTDDFISKNNHIDWAKIKGLRNIIAHDYFGSALRWRPPRAGPAALGIVADPWWILGILGICAQGT